MHQQLLTTSLEQGGEKNNLENKNSLGELTLTSFLIGMTLTLDSFRLEKHLLFKVNTIL